MTMHRYIRAYIFAQVWKIYKKAYKFNVKLKERVFQLIQKQGHAEVYFIFNISCLFIIKQCGVFRSSCSR